MGYRSQVSFTIVGPREIIIANLVTYRLQEKHAKEALDYCRFINDGDDLIIKFSVNDWKWYESYEDVDALNLLFTSFEELEDDNINGAFVRIGESDDDIETKYFGNDPYDLERVVRSIESQYFEGNGVKLEDLRNELCATNAD